MSIYRPTHHFSWPIFAVNILDLVGHVAVPPRLLGYPSLSSMKVDSVPWDLLSVAGVPLQRPGASGAHLPADAVSRSAWKLPTLRPYCNDGCWVGEFTKAWLPYLGLEHLWGVTSIPVCWWNQTEAYPAVGLKPVVPSMLGFPFLLWPASPISLPISPRSPSLRNHLQVNPGLNMCFWGTRPKALSSHMLVSFKSSLLLFCLL